MIALTDKTIDKMGKFLLTDDLIPLSQPNKVAVPWPIGSETVLSQQANGSWETRTRDQISTNETATVCGNTITFNIPEGVFVYALVTGL